MVGAKSLLGFKNGWRHELLDDNIETNERSLQSTLRPMNGGVSSQHYSPTTESNNRDEKIDVLVGKLNCVRRNPTSNCHDLKAKNDRQPQYDDDRKPERQFSLFNVKWNGNSAAPVPSESSASRGGKMRGIFSPGQRETKLKSVETTNKSQVSSLQMSHLYSTRNSNRAKKPLYLVDSVPVPRLAPGEKMPYLLPPRFDDSSTESNDDISFHLPDLDCTDSTIDRQTSTDPSFDRSELDTLDTTLEIDHPVNLSLVTTTTQFDCLEGIRSHLKSISVNSNGETRPESLTGDLVNLSKEGNHEMLIQLTISQVGSDISDPMTVSSVEASTSDSSSGSKGTSCIWKLGGSSESSPANVNLDNTWLKHESLPALYLGPLNDAVHVAKQTKADIIDVAIALNHDRKDNCKDDQKSQDYYEGEVVLEDFQNGDQLWSASIPFKSGKAGYYSVIDPLDVKPNNSQLTTNDEQELTITKYLLQSGRIIQALNQTISLLNSGTGKGSSKDLCVILRNASALQMMIGRFHDSADLLKQISQFDQDEIQTLQSITFIMLGVSLYGCENYYESYNAFERCLRLLRLESRRESNNASNNLHLLHSFIKTLNNMGCCSYYNGNLSSAVKSFSGALGIVFELAQRNAIEDELFNVSSLSLNLQQLSLFRTKALERLPVSFKRTVSAIFCNLAYAFGKTNEFSWSSVCLDKALKIQQLMPPNDHVFATLIDTMDSLAYCLRKTDRVNAAIRLYKMILKTERRLFRNEQQYLRCMENASSFCQALQKIKASSIEI